MDKIFSINTIKNVFSALGAKTSDDNYGVALLDKTSGEPKGFMGMSDLASVLRVSRWRGQVSSVEGIKAGDSFYAANVPGFPYQYIKCIALEDNCNSIIGIGYDGHLYYRPSSDSGWTTI